MRQLTTRTFVILLIFLFPIYVFCQDKSNTPSSNTRSFSIGLNLSPDLCYRTLSNNDGSSTSASLISTRNRSEIPKYSFTTGAVICYKFNKHFEFESGLQFSNKGYSTRFRNTDMRFPDQIDPTKGFTNPTNEPGKHIEKSRIIYSHYYLDIPLRFVYSFGEDRIRFVSSLGVTTNILLKSTQRSVMKFTDGSKERRKPQEQLHKFKTVNVSPVLSAGADYKINRKLNLRVERTFRLGVMKIIDSPVTAYLWNAATNVTIYYKL